MRLADAFSESKLEQIWEGSALSESPVEASETNAPGSYVPCDCDTRAS